MKFPQANNDQNGATAENYLVVALMPYTPRLRALAIGVVVVIVLLSAIVAPFAGMQIGRIDSFLPVVQTVLSAADLFTATLLFVQFSVYPHRALLAVASGYVLSGSFAFLQTLSFPGSYAPDGLFGDVYNTPAWLAVLWFGTFPLSVLAYVLLKDRGKLSRGSTTASIGITLTCAVGIIATFSWFVTNKSDLLPNFFLASIAQPTSVGYHANAALALLTSFVLLVLYLRRRTILDLWLMVTLLAWIPGFLSVFLAGGRFTLGWYSTRGFALIASCLLLSVLLTEMILLYSRLASALTMQRRERSNRLVSIDAATAAIAHEIRSPLASITLNSRVAREQVLERPPNLLDMDVILKDIEDASLRAEAVIASVRGMFKDAADQSTTINVEDVAKRVLRLVQHELRTNEISVVTEFRDDKSAVHADLAQLQQVMLNLVMNAIEATKDTPPDRRRLNIGTRLEGSSSVVLFVQDTGAGVRPEDQERIFEAFFTTKRSGMGLGLAICRTIVERHHGKLVLASSSAQGSAFEVTLPLVSLAKAR
ncbi:MASE4 domain-containing protein [Bradyrhizobium diazoefficiens]|nr:MASE4 domain-containing protein [Bradyrhizobium diazoefficiens]MBR0777225.1 MASE4 domain-containing protein [Bradyrhizobium diazoefficiens]MBR0851621.1 MASE4 domain-containing protein [Bradyrhizobium diazoefficiens]